MSLPGGSPRGYPGSPPTHPRGRVEALGRHRSGEASGRFRLRLLDGGGRVTQARPPDRLAALRESQARISTLDRQLQQAEHRAREAGARRRASCVRSGRWRERRRGLRPGSARSWGRFAPWTSASVASCCGSTPPSTRIGLDGGDAERGAPATRQWRCQVDRHVVRKRHAIGEAAMPLASGLGSGVGRIGSWRGCWRSSYFGSAIGSDP